VIDESCGKSSDPDKRVGVRTRVMDSLQLNPYMIPRNPMKRIADLGTILRLMVNGIIAPGRPRKPVNIEELSGKWVEAIAGMCLSHSKDEYDKHDSAADELLTPLLTAPVKQIREFYTVLRTKLESDKRVPFLVWISFEAWGEAVIKNAPDEKVRRLKHALARDIAELVEGPAAKQLPEAIKRALCWRDPETLQEVKDALVDGAKPKIVGRQSCLFLEMKTPGRKGKKVSVMI
jgi:hypothetical protein